MKCKPLGVIFALCTLLGPVFMMSALQTKTAVTALADAFGTSELIWAVIMVVLVAAVVCGGLTRVGKVAEFVAPIMCAIYMLVGIVILVIHIDRLPSVIAIMFQSAFTKNSVYGAIFGSMVKWGVKRGLYSNDAGDGMGPVVSSAADCAHPSAPSLRFQFSCLAPTMSRMPLEQASLQKGFPMWNTVCCICRKP